MYTHSPCQHGVEQHPETPDINSSVVALLLEDFGGHKVSRVARGHQQTILRSQLLGKTKVSNAQDIVGTILLGVEDVGGLEVTMDHSLLVEVLDSGGLQHQGRGERGEIGGSEEGRRG